eukprot:m.211850 g.211850  ORF g.211850 m.211850 type:complete len:324 (-) comp18579_c0_seq5:63-1034(-)
MAAEEASVVADLPRLLFLTAGVFSFYLAYGVLQEQLFHAGLKQYGWFITLIQFVIYAILSKLEMFARRIRRSGLSLRVYVLISMMTVATMGFSNTSLEYLNYPTQVMFKSCKLIPVMIGGILIQGKRYTLLEFQATLLLCAGLVVFTLADVSASATFDPTGVLLISCALVADAMIGNVQEKNMKQHNVTNTEMVHYSYGIGVVIIFAICLANGQLYGGTQHCQQLPLTQTAVPMVLFSVSGYLGVSFVLSLVKSFGALTAVTVTNLRKAFTMVLSFLVFPKPFAFQYLVGGGLVFAGIGLSVYSKQLKRRAAATKPLGPEHVV